MRVREFHEFAHASRCMPVRAARSGFELTVAGIDRRQVAPDCAHTAAAILNDARSHGGGGVLEEIETNLEALSC